MGMEGAPKQGNIPKQADESLLMTRRGFLRLAGDAVLAGVAKQAGIEELTRLPNGEIIPSERDVMETFNFLRGGHSCRETRKESDKDGVFLWEIEYRDDEGTIEFGYMRKGERGRGRSPLATKIHIVLYDKDGMPYGGTDVAEFKDGKWVIDTATLEKLTKGEI